MQAEDWMNREVHTCRPETSMNEAAHLMWQHDCGVLPLVDAEAKVLGVVTDRDLFMGAHFCGRSLQDLRVGEAMSHSLFTCRPSDSIEQVIRQMGDHQVRRVPVVDARGRLVGVLSMNDLVRRLVSLQEPRLRATLEPRLVEALASICETRAAAQPPELIPDRTRPRREPTAVA